MYEITSMQDVSRPRCRRYVAHIDVNSDSKDKIKAAILKATEEIKSTYSPVHVVRLYVHMGDKLACQSMWVDKTIDSPLPKPLNYNDSIDDIGIVW